MDDLGLTPAQQLELHELTEQAMTSVRVDPFGDIPTVGTNTPWNPIATVSIDESDLDEEIERLEAEYGSSDEESEESFDTEELEESESEESIEQYQESNDWA